MEGEQPASKRAKKSDTKTESDVEPKPGTSSPSVAAASVDIDERKRKVPKAKVVPANYLDLDDQCQFMVLDHLSLNDLSAMAEVCVKYKEIAQSYFVQKHHNLNLASLVEVENGKFTLLQLRRLLYNFGHLISSLTINLDLLNERDGIGKLLTLVSKYSISTLYELTFEQPPNAGRRNTVGGDGIADILFGISGISEYMVASMLGTELMMMDAPPGAYYTHSKTTFRRGQSVQVQELRPRDPAN